MAANLDKSENSLTSVSTLTYLRGIDASGNSVKISTSDLASVLGEGANFNVSFSGDLNDYSRPLPPTVLFSPSNLSAQNLPPISRSHSFFFSVSVSYVHANHSSDNTRVLQTAVDIEDGSTWFRIKRGSGWSGWTEFSINIPSFYKNYSNISSLASDVGLEAIWFKMIPANSTLTAFRTQYGRIYSICITGTGNVALVAITYNEVKVIYNDYGIIKDTNHPNGTFTLSVASYYVSVTNNTSTDQGIAFL